MYFVGLGHSHVVALAKGAYALERQGATIGGERFTCGFHYLYDAAFEPVLFDAAGKCELNSKLLEAARSDDPRFILLSIGGNEHNVLSIAQLHQRYDFILGEQPELALDESLEIVPEAAIRETLRARMSATTDILRALRDALPAPMIQIEPPPPLPRAQVLAYPKEFFRSALDQRKMSPDLLRYKMWRVQVGLLRALCAELGVLYVETLPDMIDSTGMLGAGAWGADATHANDLYGEAMVREALRRMVDHLAGQG